jgi:pyridoxal phosphate enzyme (YggS family)
MNSICNNIRKIQTAIPENVILVAVSKTKPVQDILTAYQCGHRHFGENKVQELVGKYEALPKDIHWHLIGHLQRNKVKYVAPFVYLIHGVDNLKLVKEIDKQALKNERMIDILLQIKIAREETKYGMDEMTLKEIINLYRQNEFPNIRIKGLMGMATFTTDTRQIAAEFDTLHRLFDTYKNDCKEFQYLSMGMSGDYEIAIQNGSNMIRVGSAIFGERQYP